MEERSGLWGLMVLGVGGVAGAGLLTWRGSPAFQPYFGRIDPAMGTAAVALALVTSLWFLQRGGWLAIRREADTAGSRWVIIAVAALLPIPVVIVDLLGGFPRDINVLLPEALVFYPVIAIVAETVFHVVPLALLLGLLSAAAERVGRERLIGVCIVLASAIEPIFQVLMARGESPVWAVTYVGLHLAVFNLVALYFFKRYDFFTVYVFRIVYYLQWHIVWGFLRLHLLYA
jgi:hypothetical protein